VKRRGSTPPVSARLYAYGEAPRLYAYGEAPRLDAADYNAMRRPPSLWCRLPRYAAAYCR
jgi:hypothetical protein